MVFDPKERTICAAPFRDRVAHHAIMNVAEPHFESYQIDDSYACRRGKGLDAAIARAVRFSGPGDWYLKMDVRKYFDSVDHNLGFRVSLARRKAEHVRRTGQGPSPLRDFFAAGRNRKARRVW